MEHWVVQVLTGIIAGGVAGFLTGGFFKSLTMGTAWNVLVGALCGYVLANVFLAYGFNDHNPWIWCLIWALIGGGLGQMFIGWIQYGLKVFWMVVTGREDEIPLEER